MGNEMKIGAGLALDGEKEFKSAVAGINKDLSVLGSEMKKVTSEFGENANSMEALKAKSEVYNRQIDEQKNKVTTLTNALENAKKEYGENSDKVKDWQVKLNNAESQLNQTENALRETTEQAKKLDREKFENFHNGLKNAGAIAAKMALAIAAAGAAAAAGIAKMTLSAAQNADEINTLSKQTGLSTEEIQKFQYASERIDVSLETLTKSMAKNIKSMAGVQNGTKEVTEAYAQLGVEVLNSDGSLRDGQTVYGEVIDALSIMENETQRDALAMQLLGKSAQDLNPLIEGGSELLKIYGEEAEKAGLILGQDALDKLNLLADAFDKLKATLGGSGSVFATAFAGPLTEGINKITSFLERLGTAFTEGGIDGLSEELSIILNEVIQTIVAFMPTFIEMGVKLLTAILTGIIENIPTLLLAVPKMVLALVKAFGSIMESINQVGYDIVAGVWKGIQNAALWFSQKVQSFFSGIVNGIKKSLGIKSPSTVFAEIGGYMAEGLGVGFTDEMSNVTKKINNSVPANVSMNGSYAVEGIVNGLSAVMGGQSATSTINLILDKKTLAQVIFDPLKGVAIQRGVSLA